MIQRQVEEKGELLQTKRPSNSTSGVTPDIETNLNALRGSGQPLPESVRAFFEPRFGYDFSQVMLHTGARAASVAQAVNARAFTVGNSVVFGAGQYAPGPSVGQRLLAHELTHVIQQRQARRDGHLQRTCGKTAIGTTPPAACTLVSDEPKGARFLFNVDCDEFALGEKDRLEEVATKIPSNATIDVLGLASSDGDPAFNETLSCLRASAGASVLREKGLGRNIRSVRATGGIGSPGDATLRAVDIRVAEAPPPVRPKPTPVTQDIKVVVKSFIAPIGTRIGIPAPCLTLLPSAALACQLRLAGLARVTDAAFSENPRNDKKDKGYRLFSERTFTVTCQDGSLVRVVSSALDTDAGKEGPLQPPPLITSSIIARRVGPSTFAFGWFAKGRPHAAAEPAFQLVAPRTSVFIWHTIGGVIDCSGPRIRVTIGLSDSRFPSDRVFVNNRVVTSSRQGLFSDLWTADPSDRTLVR